MRRRRVTQRAGRMPASEQGSVHEGDAEAAAVLAAMPTGQSLLHWVTPAADEAVVSTTDTLPMPAGPSAARPPLARGPTLFGGVTPPPRRPARTVASLTSSAPGRAGPSRLVQGRTSASGTGTPPRVAATLGRTHVLASPAAGATLKLGTDAPIPSPVSVSAAAEIGVPKSSVSQRSPGAPPALVAPPAPVAPEIFVAPASPIAPPAPVAPESPVTLRADAVGLLPAPTPPSQGSRPPLYDVTASLPAAHRPSVVSAALQQRLSAVAAKPRVLAFRSPRLVASDLEGVMERSLTPTPSQALPKTQKVIQKRTYKPRAKRTSKDAEKLVGRSAAAPDHPPTTSVAGAAGSIASTPADAPLSEAANGATGGSSGVTVAALTRVFAEGLRPVCAHLVGLGRKLEEVQTTVNRMSTSMHNQGVGNERTAQAVVQLQGAVKGAISGAGGAVKTEPGKGDTLRGGTSCPDNLDERLALAVCNEAEVSDVRDVAKRAMILDIVKSTSSFKAMPSRARALEILYSATERVRKLDRQGAETYLESRRIFLLSDGAPADKMTRVSEKLHRVRSHVIESLQKVAMLAYFKTLGVNVTTMSNEEAHKWLANNTYASSKKANDAVNAALTAIFLRSGAKERVVQPTDVGEEMYVDASTGHVALVTLWARGVFEKIAGVRKPRRSGNDDCAYDGWREEVRRVSALLRRHDDIEGGLRLCDGNDKRRAMVVADDGTFVVDDSDEDVDGQVPVASLELDDMMVEDAIAAASKTQELPEGAAVDIDAPGDAAVRGDAPVEAIVTWKASGAATVSGDAPEAAVVPEEAPGDGTVMDGAPLDDPVDGVAPRDADVRRRLAMEADDEVEEAEGAPCELPESSMYPLGFGEYLEEEPLE